MSKQSGSRSNNRRKVGKRGYRLHDERIAYSGGQKSIRSIKFEVLNPESSKVELGRGTGLQSQVAAAIAADYRTMYGPLNFDEYLADDKRPSLLDFWLKALSLGFVFSNQNSIESEFLNYLGKKTVWQRCYAGLSNELKTVLNEKSFQDFLIRLHRSVEQKSDEARQKIIFNLAKKDADTSALEPIAKNWSQNFCLSQEQLAFKCQIFGIKKPELPTRSLSLSFAVDPNFAVMKIGDRTDFLDKIIDFYSQKCSEDQVKRFLAIGDKGNYFNGLFGNLLTSLKTDKIDEIANFLDETYELNRKNVIKSRLKELKKIANQIDEPKLVAKWSDYRNDFDGAIGSWYTSRIVKQQMAIDQLLGKEETNRQTGEITFKNGLVQKLTEIAEKMPDDSKIKDGILAETIAFIKGEASDGKIERAFTVELEIYLATLKSDLNEWSQQNKDEAAVLPTGWQKDLSKHIQSSPLFFGENKYTLWRHLIELKNLIREEIKKLEKILNKQFSDYEITDKQIDMLAQLFNRIINGGNNEVVKRLAKIQRELGLDFALRDDKSRFYLSGFEHGKYRQLDITKRIHVKNLVKLANLGELYKNVKANPQDDFILRDTVQLSKIVLSALVRGSDREFEVNLAHSNLSGYANLISKRQFISRSTVQAVNGMQVCLAVGGSKYFYAFSSEKFSKTQPEVQLFAKTYNFNASDLKDKTANAPVLAVRSSRYQVQFLDWLVGRQGKRKTTLGAGGAFAIVEKTVKLDWSGKRPKITELSDPRVFVSQPFEIKPTSEGKPAPNNRFIGVDIGEYGLAWSLVEVNGQEINELDSGFIDDRQQQTLKQDVKNLRQRQVRATFNSPDSKIARVRESLIGSYRNQLEDLAIRKNARLSFEYEVSGFETGGAKIAKIYDSIKRGDVRRKDNNAENKMAWGDKGSDIWGFETTAAGTSQFCTHCKSWASLDIEDNSDYTLEEYQDGLFKTKLKSGRNVRLFAKNQSAGDILKGKALKSLIYKAMRPNMFIDGSGRTIFGGMKIVERKLGKKNFTKLQENFGVGKPRGNIAIFVCPYIDCQHISDADKQAAFNIAVRGYLKSANPDRAKKPGENGLSAKWCCEQESELIFAPVDIVL
jgi:hypothetical protein